MVSAVILVLLIIVVAVVILLMKNIENSKKMDALRNDTIERSNKKEAELSVQPGGGWVPPLEVGTAMKIAKEKTVGDQSLALEKSKQKEAEYNARKIQTVTSWQRHQDSRGAGASVRRMDGTYFDEPSRQSPADGNRTETVWGSRPKIYDMEVLPPLEMIPVPDDIETVGDQSLVLDEDQSQEYDEMAAVSGIREVAPPQTDENWVASRQVEPVKDLSVGIAITNDVSKKENLQTGKISSKFPILHKGPKIPTIDINQNRALLEATRRAAQQRDSEIKNVMNNKARSMAKAAEMEKRARIDNSGIKQYDIPKGRSPSFGLMKPAVMPNDYNKTKAAIMKDATKKAAAEAAMEAVAKMKAREEKMIYTIKADNAAREASQITGMNTMVQMNSPINQVYKNVEMATAMKIAKEKTIKLEKDDIESLKRTRMTVKEIENKAAMEAAEKAAKKVAAEKAAKKVAAERAAEDAQQRFFAVEAAKKAAAERAAKKAAAERAAKKAAAERAAKKAAAKRATEDAQQRFFAAEAAAERAAKKAADEKAAAKKAADEKAAAEKAAAKKAADEKAAAKKAADEKAATEKAAIIIAFDDLGIPVTTNGRCGRLFGARCPGKQCCSGSGWCAGRQGEISGWCSYSNRGHFVGINNGQYDGLG